MAYSMYAYLRPEILQAGIPFWDKYFSDNPWLKKPMDGDVNLFTHVKPRIENGNDRFIAFMDAVEEAGDNLVELHADTWNNPTPEQIKELMFQLGYLDLIDKVKFE